MYEAESCLSSLGTQPEPKPKSKSQAQPPLFEVSRAPIVDLRAKSIQIFPLLDSALDET